MIEIDECYLPLRFVRKVLKSGPIILDCVNQGVCPPLTTCSSAADSVGKPLQEVGIATILRE